MKSYWPERGTLAVKTYCIVFVRAARKGGAGPSHCPCVIHTAAAAGGNQVDIDRVVGCHVTRYASCCSVEVVVFIFASKIGARPLECNRVQTRFCWVVDVQVIVVTGMAEYEYDVTTCLGELDDADESPVIVERRRSTTTK